MTRASPEAAIQMAVKEYLTYALPPSIYWTASLTGTHLSMRARTKAKAMGVQRGLPDLLFLFPDGVTRYIEMKAPGGSLSPEQKAFRDRCEPHHVWGLAKSVEDVVAILDGWGVELRAVPAGVLLRSSDQVAA